MEKWILLFVNIKCLVKYFFLEDLKCFFFFKMVFFLYIVWLILINIEENMFCIDKFNRFLI